MPYHPTLTLLTVCTCTTFISMDCTVLNVLQCHLYYIYLAQLMSFSIMYPKCTEPINSRPIFYQEVLYFTKVGLNHHARWNF